MSNPGWQTQLIRLMLILSGLCFAGIAGLLPRQIRQASQPETAIASLSTAEEKADPSATLSSTLPQLGPRHYLDYDQWTDLLRQEAIAMQEQQPENLAILLGDSISLWFPPDLLPDGYTWLNQGISGDTSEGVLNRVHFLDQTDPSVIVLMIGINDLIQGQDPDQVVRNIRKIVRYLNWTHPDTPIILQSILPHQGETASWEGKAKLAALPNDRIEAVNEQLAAIAAEHEIEFLNLYPLFVGSDGYLKPALSTDGLHLNEQGYLVWRTAFQLYSQLELSQDVSVANAEP